VVNQTPDFAACRDERGDTERSPELSETNTK
jgi:hypothetical protein